MSTDTHPSTIPPEHRALLLKFFKGTSVDIENKAEFVKPLHDQEFGQIKHYIDRYRGGLTREAHEMAQGDKELIKAAAISQVFKDHRVMDARLEEQPELRNIILKALQAQPGEKNLTLEEFKEVAVFLDRKNGGLRHYASQTFKEDKEMIEAAQKHRQSWEATGKSQDAGKEADEKSPLTKEDIRKKVGMAHRKAAVQSRSSSQGMEP